MSDSLGPHRLQHARLPCPSLSPRVCSNSCPLNHVLLILCHPLFLLSSIFPSSRVFSNELALPIRWPEYWSFSFSISLSNEYSVLISFRINWLDLLAVQGTLKSLLQHSSLKASVLQCSTSKEQVSFNFMAAVTIHNHFGSQENSLSLFPLSLHLFA